VVGMVNANLGLLHSNIWAKDRLIATIMDFQLHAHSVCSYLATFLIKYHHGDQPAKLYFFHWKINSGSHRAFFIFAKFLPRRNSD
jgi:hypothetical protein